MASTFSNSIGDVTMTETTLNYATSREALMITAQAHAEQIRPGQSTRAHHGAHVFLVHKVAEGRLLVLILEPGGASHSILANAIAWSVETIAIQAAADGENADELLATMSPNGLVDFHQQMCLECP